MSAFAATAQTANIKLAELRPGFAAEITGLDFTNGVTEDVFRFVQDAVTKASLSYHNHLINRSLSLLTSTLQYGVVVLRSTNLTDETHIKLARTFGELDDVKPYIAAGRKNRLRYDELFDVSNVEEDGSLVDPESPRAQANKVVLSLHYGKLVINADVGALVQGNSLFHVDSSFNPRRAGYSLLLAHELPPPGTGGATAFADTRTAFDDLDSATKQDLLEHNYIAAHSILHSKKLAAPEFFANINPADYPMGRHYLVQRHEPSGRINLYLAAHIHHIEGLETEESKRLFEKLFRHATQEKYLIEIRWKNVGDLIIWDNTCTMHRAVGGSFAGKYRRDMRRATVHDGSSWAWGLNDQSNMRQGLP